MDWKPFTGRGLALSQADVEAAAARMKTEPAAVWAVCDVESAGGGLLKVVTPGGPIEVPKILEEPRVFGQLTKHRWDTSHPTVSARFWNRQAYGAGGTHQYDKLTEALALDHTAALEACSWGMFQVLGMNYQACGFETVDAFVTAMCDGEPAQLDAFVKFCQHNGLDRWLRSHDWTRFALGYNGPGERANAYDTKLSTAFSRRLRALPRHAALPGHTEAPHTIGLAIAA